MSVGIGEFVFTLIGNLQVATNKGFATFQNLAADKMENPRLRFLYLLPDRSLVFITSTLQVLSGSPHQLGITAQPGWSTNEGGTAFPWQPAVQVQDARGNPVAQVIAVTATLAVVATPGAATIGTTIETTQASGELLYDNLSVDLVGVGHRLRFSAQGLQDTVSDMLNIWAGPPSRL